MQVQEVIDITYDVQGIPFSLYLAVLRQLLTATSMNGPSMLSVRDLDAGLDAFTSDDSMHGAFYTSRRSLEPAHTRLYRLSKRAYASHWHVTCQGRRYGPERDVFGGNLRWHRLGR